MRSGPKTARRPLPRWAKRVPCFPMEGATRSVGYSSGSRTPRSSSGATSPRPFARSVVGTATIPKLKSSLQVHSCSFARGAWISQPRRRRQEDSRSSSDRAPSVISAKGQASPRRRPTSASPAWRSAETSSVTTERRTRRSRDAKAGQPRDRVVMEFTIWRSIFWAPPIASSVMLLLAGEPASCVPGSSLPAGGSALVFQGLAGLFSPIWVVGLVLQVIVALFLALKLRLP